MKNFGDIQKLAQKMQADMAKAQEELGAMTVEAPPAAARSSWS